MSKLRVAALLSAILCGTLLLLLAHDVRSWRDALRAAGLEYSVASTKPVHSTAPAILPSNLSRRLLSVARDREWLTALQKFNVAYQSSLNDESLDRTSYALINQAEGPLRKLTQDPDATRSSQAYDLLAVLVSQEAYLGRVTDPTLVQEAVTDFQNAVHLDPTNDTAKENLELSLRVLAAARSRNRGRTPANHASTKHTGGYGEPAGEGY